MGLFFEGVRWLIAVPAGLLFALRVLGNWLTLIAAMVERGRRGYTFVPPFFGPAFGLIFFFSVPIPGAARYWWLPSWPTR